MKKSVKIFLGIFVVMVLAVVAFFAGSSYYDSKQKDEQLASMKTESTNKASKYNHANKTSTKTSKSVKDSTSSSSVASETTSNSQSTSSVETPQIKPITLDEGLALIQKAGGEVPSDSTEIISSNGVAITIGGGAGAKGYDKITLTPDADGNVAIHEEFGTLDGGSYSVLDYMPAEDYTTTR